jgi:malonate transporter and related proteins
VFSSFPILLPVFGLILAGFVCRRTGVLGPNAAPELNRFVVWLALPALLFDVMAHASWQQFNQPAFVATFALACGAVFGLILILRILSGRHLADASVDAIAASYPNTGYVGFPLCMIVFGPASLTPTTIASILVVCVLFAAGIILIELGLQTEKRPHQIAFGVMRSLARNPLIVSPIAGLMMTATHLPVPAAAETFLKLLSSAASPCALVSLGLFLAEKPPVTETKTDRGSWLLTGAKLVLQPILTWWLADRGFALSQQLVEMAVVLAALPTGTGPYMLAEFYRREARVASRTILLSTIGSVVSLSVLLAVLFHHRS